MPLKKGSSQATIKDTDLAYAAGILDGEGSIGARKHFHLRASFSITISVTMCDKEVPEFMASLFGGKVRMEKQKTSTGKSIYGWYLHCKNAANALHAMLPFLIIKKQRAIDAIQLQSMMRSRGGRGLKKHISENEITSRLEVVARIRAANFSSNARIRSYAPN